MQEYVLLFAVILAIIALIAYLQRRSVEAFYNITNPSWYPYNDDVDYPIHNNSSDNYYNYCQWGKQNNFCNTKVGFPSACRDECRPAHPYDSKVFYPKTNNSNDSYYNYCKHGQSNGWCNSKQGFSNACKDECR